MDPENDRTLSLYLLGRLSEGEEIRLETEYLQSPALQDELLAAETELIDAYVRGELPAADQKALESGFLQSTRGQERLALARALLGRPARTAAAPSAGRFWPMAAAAAVLVVAGSAGLLWLRPPSDDGGAGASGPAPRPPVSASALPQPEQWADLYPGRTRSGGEAALVERAPVANEILFRLHLDADPHGRYNVALRGSDFRVTDVASRRADDGAGAVIAVRVPARALADGEEQELVLSPAAQPEKAIRVYAFVVTPRR